MFKTPEDTYRDYNRYIRKGNFRRAYQCLKSLLHEFPEDEELMEGIVDLCLTLKRPDRARQWIRKLTGVRSFWKDYVLLSQVEAELGNIPSAKGNLKKAIELNIKLPIGRARKEVKRVFSEAERFIKYREYELNAKEVKEKHAKTKVKAPGDKRSQSVVNKVNAGAIPEKDIIARPVTRHKKKIETHPKQDGKKQPGIIPSYAVTVRFSPPDREIFNSFRSLPVSDLKESRLFVDYAYLTIQGGFDELLCLNAINGVERYWYQLETVKKVLKHFHGRVLLCDEVGLGKTIEAGMLIKEYMMRGMARNVLILTPPSLVSQWKEEMLSKFGIEFLTTEDVEFTRDVEDFWKKRNIIASLNTAKSKRNTPLITKEFYDIVIVDEAHRLRNRTTLAWKLVNQIKKRFIFLLTATPVQNNLIELYNLITLLKPGQFKTERLFKKEYVMKGNLRFPSNKERLRELLRDVMIRNTRSAIDVKLPKRFATTLRLKPTETERNFYTILYNVLRKTDLKKPMLNLILREAGSSPYALKGSVTRMEGMGDLKEAIDLIDGLEDISKGKALIDILKKNHEEKVIVFTHYLKTMDYIMDLLLREGLPYVTFRGDMNVKDKNIAIERFKNEIPLLVSTESGGEGRNLQFCNTIINFDLPWNPMRIEQRIGRLHRIGQRRDVFIFNLSIKETIEDYIIDILDSKINMFEMVIGEIEPILGHIEEEKDFEGLIMEIWLKSRSHKEMEEGFGELGKEFVKAKEAYLKTKELDDEIFGEDYET